MHCGSEKMSSFEKQATSTWLSFVGFSLTELVMDYEGMYQSVKTARNFIINL